MFLDQENGVRKPREINREHLKIISNLGKGQFGTVDKAIIDERRHGIPGYLCAVKQLVQSAQTADITALMEESAIMAQLDCDFCVRLIGVVTVGKPMMMIVEYCEHGSLNHFLQKRDEIPEDRKVLFAGDCCEGLAYLASKNFIHLDVAARNVLVSSELRTKISDFGMSREAEESDYYQSRGGALPIRWCAPEVLENRKFSPRSDVYAAGILLYEIWTKGATPYSDMKWNNQKVWAMVTSGYRLTCPSGCPNDVFSIMAKCWHEDPHERPTAAEMRDFFRNRPHPLVAQAPTGHSSTAANTGSNQDTGTGGSDTLDSVNLGANASTWSAVSLPSTSSIQALVGGSNTAIKFKNNMYIDGDVPTEASSSIGKGAAAMNDSMAAIALNSLGTSTLERLTSNTKDGYLDLGPDLLMDGLGFADVNVAAVFAPSSDGTATLTSLGNDGRDLHRNGKPSNRVFPLGAPGSNNQAAPMAVVTKDADGVRKGANDKGNAAPTSSAGNIYYYDGDSPDVPPIAQRSLTSLPNPGGSSSNGNAVNIYYYDEHTDRGSVGDARNAGAPGDGKGNGQDRAGTGPEKMAQNVRGKGGKDGKSGSNSSSVHPIPSILEPKSEAKLEARHANDLGGNGLSPPLVPPRSREGSPSSSPLTSRHSPFLFQVKDLSNTTSTLRSLGQSHSSPTLITPNELMEYEEPVVQSNAIQSNTLRGPIGLLESSDVHLLPPEVPSRISTLKSASAILPAPASESSLNSDYVIPKFITQQPQQSQGDYEEPQPGRASASARSSVDDTSKEPSVPNIAKTHAKGITPDMIRQSLQTANGGMVFSSGSSPSILGSLEENVSAPSEMYEYG